jgi:hypothetical protein
MTFFDKDSILLSESPNGRRKLKNNLTEINFLSSCNVSNLLDNLRAKFHVTPDDGIVCRNIYIQLVSYVFVIIYLVKPDF